MGETERRVWGRGSQTQAQPKMGGGWGCMGEIGEDHRGIECFLSAVGPDKFCVFVWVCLRPPMLIINSVIWRRRTSRSPIHWYNNSQNRYFSLSPKTDPFASVILTPVLSPSLSCHPLIGGLHSFLFSFSLLPSPPHGKDRWGIFIWLERQKPNYFQTSVL